MVSLLKLIAYSLRVSAYFGFVVVILDNCHYKLHNNVYIGTKGYAFNFDAVDSMQYGLIPLSMLIVAMFLEITCTPIKKQILTDEPVCEPKKEDKKLDTN